MNCNENKGMTPVELGNPIDRKWRQVRDKANKDVAVRTAIVELEESILTRALEIEEEAAAMMCLGGLAPNVVKCMGNDLP